jgi:hypothetical protein
MVSIMWSVISFALGALLFLGLPALGPSLSLPLRVWLGRAYLSLSMKGWGMLAVVWRLLGGPKLKPMQLDDEGKTAEITLSSGKLSDDQTLPFKDPDSRLHRLQGKPLAIVPEPWPAAVDAELSEVGHWIDQKGSTQGFERGDQTVDPYVPMRDSLRAINPMDAIYAAAKGVDPENVKTAKELTEARFELYGRDIGAVETAATLLAFATTAGAVVGMVYVKEEVIASGGGGGGGPDPIGIGGFVQPDALFQLLGGIPL